MESFDIVNITTIWNIILAINKAHNESCSMQVIRHYRNNGSRFIDPLSVMMVDHSIPMLLVDIEPNTKDMLLYKYVKLSKSIPLAIRCIIFSFRRELWHTLEKCFTALLICLTQNWRGISTLGMAHHHFIPNFSFSYRINPYLMKWTQKEPEVTNCLILIQESKDDPVELFDAYLLQTAVEKYYIGLGHRYQNYKFVQYGVISPESVPYSIIQIDYQGRTAVKCPTISGGKWFRGTDWTICNQNYALSTKGEKVNFLTDQFNTTPINIFWMLLIFVEALQCDFNIYYLLKNKITIDLTGGQIRPLKKYNTITTVS